MDEVLERLYTREVSSLRQLQHPNIIRLLGVGSVDKYGHSRHCVFLEWMPGGDARTLLDQAMRGMDERAAGSICLSVARGLEAAHRWVG